MSLPTPAVAAGRPAAPTRTVAGKQVGPALENFAGAQAPSRTEPLVGQYVTLVPLSYEEHRDALAETLWKKTDEAHWSYMPYPHPETEEGFNAWLKKHAEDPALFSYAILASPAQRGVAGSSDTTQQAVGCISLMRFDYNNGCDEIGHVLFSPLLQRTRSSTEAVYLLLALSFEKLNVRRVEWKADSLNAPSRRAAARFGLTFEGIFYKHTVYKGRSRDTAWFAMIEDDWPVAKKAFQLWLQPSNFGPEGQQVRDLVTLRQELAA